MDELLTMSNAEITRLEVMQRLKDKRLVQKEAARMLGISRQVKRLYRATGARVRVLVSQAANLATTGGARTTGLDLIMSTTRF
jgi:predicted DNA-binding protein (UPF0251 family)